MADLCVLYLVWAPLGADPLERFISSYRARPAGAEHELVLLLAGGGTRSLIEQCARLVEELDARSLRLERAGLDLENYRSAAIRLEARRICFLNSYSEILADGWLAALEAAHAAPEVGLVGATGTYESPLSAAPRPLKPFLRRRFPPFPNPHLRTNAFMLERELLLELDWPRIRRKRDALALESGKASISRQMWERGLEAVVVGRDRRAYPQEAWPASRTFRSGRQENLLVGDNRTRQYMEADERRRRELVGFAWGADAFTSPRPSPTPPG